MAPPRSRIPIAHPATTNSPSKKLIRVPTDVTGLKSKKPEVPEKTVRKQLMIATEIQRLSDKIVANDHSYTKNMHAECVEAYKLAVRLRRNHKDWAEFCNLEDWVDKGAKPTLKPAHRNQALRYLLRLLWDIRRGEKDRYETRSGALMPLFDKKVSASAVRRRIDATGGLVKLQQMHREKKAKIKPACEESFPQPSSSAHRHATEALEESVQVSQPASRSLAGHTTLNEFVTDILHRATVEVKAFSATRKRE